MLENTEYRSIKHTSSPAQCYAFAHSGVGNVSQVNGTYFKKVTDSISRVGLIRFDSDSARFAFRMMSKHVNIHKILIHVCRHCTTFCPQFLILKPLYSIWCTYRFAYFGHKLFDWKIRPMYRLSRGYIGTKIPWIRFAADAEMQTHSYRSTMHGGQNFCTAYYIWSWLQKSSYWTSV